MMNQDDPVIWRGLNRLLIFCAIASAIIWYVGGIV